MTLYKKNIGQQGEEIAANYLIDRNYTIVERNFRSKFGEIDIVVSKQHILYFVEVKTRANLKKGKPYEAVTKRKIHQMKKAATYFLLTHDYKNYKHRLSVFSILLENFSTANIRFFENVM